MNLKNKDLRKPMSGNRRGLGFATILLFSAFAIACSSEDGGGDNGGGGNNGGGDNGGGGNGGNGADYGSQCTNDSDCESGRCLPIRHDSSDSFCSEPCSENIDCPDESSCLFLTGADSSLTQACVPNDLCIDPDGDGYGSGPGCLAADCDQTNPNIHPGAREYCDGIDNNCNGVVDENPVDTGIACPTGLDGVCASGITTCINGEKYCDAIILPNQRQEVCNNEDDDCDGKIDEGPDGFDMNYIVGVGQSCGDPASGCFLGTTVCNPATRSIECDGDNPNAGLPDLCDGVDNNCNGLVDEDVTFPDFGKPCSAGLGTCRGVGTYACVPSDPAADPVCTAVANMSNATAEVCDYNDNDCDGEIDEDFKNAQGIYSQVAHCGACNNDCLREWGGNPSSFNVVPQCSVTGSNAVCSFTCVAGWRDLDGRRNNGCEFKEDATVVYVSSAENGGEDSANCGSVEEPCLTITKALSIANTTRNKIYVSEGSYREPITLKNGVSVLGGYSAVNWSRNPSVFATTIQGGSYTNQHSWTVRANGINQATTFSGFTIDSIDALAGGNAMAIWVSDSTSALVIEDNTILAGRGGAGAAGNRGSDGLEGPNGADGQARVNDSATCNVGTSPYLGGAGGIRTCGSTVVNGGSGAETSNCPSTAAALIEINNRNGNAFTGSGSNPGTAGTSTPHTYRANYNSGIYVCNAVSDRSITAGGHGGDGTHGNGGGPGSGGQVATSGGNSGLWTGNSGSTGAAGTPGSGGGGGGSSAGLYDSGSGNNAPSTTARYHYGGTGGGGGAGGCGATGGTGGSAGGASFGIWVTYTSTAPATYPTIRDNVITRGTGGRGGQGGQGGAGGQGGRGGAGGTFTVTTRWSRCGEYAAPGGNGGNGGHGGGGGGGAGGVSYDIGVRGTTTVANTYRSNNTFTLGTTTATGGQGGAGGISIQNPGSPGVQGASGTVANF